MKPLSKVKSLLEPSPGPGTISASGSDVEAAATPESEAVAAPESEAVSEPRTALDAEPETENDESPPAKRARQSRGLDPDSSLDGQEDIPDGTSEIGDVVEEAGSSSSVGGIIRDVLGNDDTVGGQEASETIRAALVLALQQVMGMKVIPAQKRRLSTT
ncbi:hypothetical protein ACHAPT_013232 [Fusarium lateritium]